MKDKLYKVLTKKVIKNINNQNPEFQLANLRAFKDSYGSCGLIKRLLETKEGIELLKRFLHYLV